MQNESVPDLTEINPDIPKEINDVVATMLAKNPEDRFQSAADAAWALAQAIELEEKALGDRRRNQRRFPGMGGIVARVG